MRLNKFFIFAFSMIIFIIVFSACDSTEEVSSTTENQPNSSQISNSSKDDSSLTKDSTTDFSKDNQNSTKEIASKNESNAKTDNSAKSSEADRDILSQYSNEQIEYARVWSQFGPNQQIDELYIRHISAGEPINPIDETSADYPEDVIQLSGSRLVDGSVTYSGNGDGTINIYQVPLRWDGKYPERKGFYTNIIENTDLVPVDVGDDQEIMKLIKLITIHHD